MIITRLYMGIAPAVFPMGDFLKWSTVAFLMFGALASALFVPVTMTALRRYTKKEYRSAGFNFWYILMNIGGIVAGGVISLSGHLFDQSTSYMAIFDFAVIMYIFAFIGIAAMKEDNFQDVEELDEETKKRQEEKKKKKKEQVGFSGKVTNFVNFIRDIGQDTAFWKLLIFMFLTAGAKFGFANMFLVMPKYYTRVISTDVEYGLLNSVNPAIIVVGLIVAVPIIKKFNTVKMIIWGSLVSAISMLPMSLPPEYMYIFPGINNINDAYWLFIWAQILIFSFGEIVWSPRLSEYAASIAPPDKIGSYMSLASLPNFIAKPLNAVISGYFLSRVCYDGIKAKIETDNLTYFQSPEFMWLVFFFIALSTPIAIIILRNWLTSSNRNVAQEESFAATDKPAEETS